MYLSLPLVLEPNGSMCGFRVKNDVRIPVWVPLAPPVRGQTLAEPVAHNQDIPK
jgi:hypothetical protein